MSGHARRLAIVLFLLLGVGPLVAAGLASLLLARAGPRVLEVEMRASGGSAAQVFWSSSWIYNEQDSSVVPLTPDPADFEIVRFSLPDRPLLSVRFDPINGPGEVVIRALRVLDDEGRQVRAVDPFLLIPLQQIERMTPMDGTVRITTAADGADPILLLRGYWLLPPPGLLDVRLVTRLALGWTTLSCFVVIATGVWLALRDAWMNPAPQRTRTALWLTALLLGIVSAKLMLLSRFPAPVPSWDQWDGELIALYFPYANAGLSWHQMFDLHNEHRIFFSRLLALALLELNGQWDPHLQMVVNALLHATVGVVFAVTLWLAAGRRLLPLWVITMALAFAPPFALENALSGFQSAFYFLVLFAALAFWGVGLQRPGSLPWFVGLLAAACCLFTVGGGVAIVVGLACIVVLNYLAAPRDFRPPLATLLALAAVGLLGYATLSPPWPHHEYLRAHTWLEFKASFARNLAFPWIDAPRVSVLVWIPLVVLACAALIRRLRTQPLERFALGLGAWVAFQAAAIAYSRGGGGAAPASRYLDMLSFGLIANTAALAAMGAWRDATGWRTAMRSALAIWLLIAGIGVYRVSEAMIEGPGLTNSAQMREYVRNLRRFIVGGDASEIVGKQGPQEVPHHNPNLLAGWLTHGYVRHILPAAIRDPIPIRPANISGGFTANRSPEDLFPVWDSYNEDRARATGTIESEIVTCREFSYLRFEVAGTPGEDGLHLVLREAGSASESAVEPALLRPWTGTVVPCPRGAFTVVGRDESPTGWMAFRSPTEMAWLSRLADAAVASARVPGWIALTLVVLAITPVSALRRRPASPRHATAG